MTPLSNANARARGGQGPLARSPKAPAGQDADTCVTEARFPTHSRVALKDHAWEGDIV